MAFDPVSAVLGIGETIIKRIWPDPAQQSEALLKLKTLEQNGELSELKTQAELMMGQMEINKVEAAHGGLFKGGWRPFVGWVCGFALAYKFVILPFLVFIIQTITHFTGTEPFPVNMLPVIEWSELSVVLMGMLGLGTLRTYEKRATAK